jgi:hypothetical protein
MIVIRRMLTRHESYTVIFLRGEPPKIIRTTEYEHGRILEIFKQDKPYRDVLNDFADNPLFSHLKPSD